VQKIKLYTYCKSSAAYRVRIALNLKNIAYDSEYISLRKDKSAHLKSDYTRINPQAMVPTLITGSSTLTQSTAIIEYLEERFPEPALLPTDKQSRALARSFAQLIACDIHPLNNVRVLDYLRENLDIEQEKVTGWYKHWIQEGFQALETRLKTSGLMNAYSIGDTPGITECFLVPQVYNAHRYQCDMTDFPIINAINKKCLELPAFRQASPEHQPDYLP